MGMLTRHVDTGVSAEDEALAEMTAAMVNYDVMMETAKKLNDPQAIRLVQQRRDSYSKRHNKLDPALKRALDEAGAKRIRERDILRAKLRKKDEVEQTAKKARKVFLAQCTEKA
jgi:hypothetical protein